MIARGIDLEALYRRFNRREFVAPDPLEVLYDYPTVADREVVGLIAACLAYGQVCSIVASLRRFLPRLGPSPAAFLGHATASDLRGVTEGFRHRWTGPDDLAALLRAIRLARAQAGSLEALLGPVEGNLPGRLAIWAAWLRDAAAHPGIDHLLPDPARGSTCKRLHLYLRWMVRSDAVDPGGWRGVDPACLVVPVDVHMHRIGRALRLTRRRSPSLRSALEITAAFRRLQPGDPVRYDFALTRFGIRERMTGQGSASLRRSLEGASRADSIDQVAEGPQVG